MQGEDNRDELTHSQFDGAFLVDSMLMDQYHIDFETYLFNYPIYTAMLAIII